MKFIPTAIQDIIIETVQHQDERGYFLESYRQDLYQENNEYHSI